MRTPKFIIKSLMTILLCQSFNLHAAMTERKTQLEYGMVVSTDKTASEVGMQILKSGGNAIDAAVAVGYALAVTLPCCGNIGGGGFMTIHLANGQNDFINFREKAPLTASREMFNQKDRQHSTSSYAAVAVPGTVLGFETALKQYGHLKRNLVIQPAIELAEKGYIVTPRHAKLFAKYADDFAKHPNVAAIFLKNGKPYQAGERLIQKDLATTLKKISKNGSNAFYKGDIAKEIVTSSEKHNGLLSRQDFESYTVQNLRPIVCSYHDYQFITAPPPSSGGVTLCESLNILENFSLGKLAFGSSNAIHFILEAMRYSFIDRNNKLGDPDFVKNPTQQLLSKDYAKKIAHKILTREKPKLKSQTETKERLQTTHYSIIDREGNAVSVTYTLNGFFGSRIIAGNTGFFLNNEMDDFATQVGKANKFGLIQNEANAIAAGKRPLSSMTPTIILKNNQTYLIIGSPGGPRIITAVLLAIINHIDYGFPIDQAINLPRYHFQNRPDLVYHEPDSFAFFTRKKLEFSGYNFLQQPTWGAVEAILIDPITGETTGVNDYRRPAGSAIGR